jgi:hypothetical protein
MFRSRPRSETSSRPTARRGSVGSASVWDEHTRAQRADGRNMPPTPRESAPSGPAVLALPAEGLEALVASIVQVALDARLETSDPLRRAELAHVLHARLLALLGGVVPSAPPSDAAAVDTEPTVLRPIDVTPESPEAIVSPTESTLGQALEDRLARLGGALAARRDLRARLIALALERMAAPTADAEASHEELRNLDVLQRRAAKLERSLRDARAALEHVLGLEHVDVGIASIYRTVQGLSLVDPARERKRALLESLFRSNLTLQKPEQDAPRAGPSEEALGAPPS